MPKKMTRPYGYNNAPAPRHLANVKPGKDLFKFSLKDVVILARQNITIDTYASRNAKDIDRMKDRPATLPRGWKNLPNL